MRFHLTGLLIGLALSLNTSAQAATQYPDLATWSTAVTGETVPDMPADNYGPDGNFGPFNYPTVYGTAVLLNGATSSGSWLGMIGRGGSIGNHFENVAASGTFAIDFDLPTTCRRMVTARDGAGGVSLHGSSTNALELFSLRGSHR